MGTLSAIQWNLSASISSNGLNGLNGIKLFVQTQYFTNIIKSFIVLSIENRLFYKFLIRSTNVHELIHEWPFELHLIHLQLVLINIDRLVTDVSITPLLCALSIAAGWNNLDYFYAWELFRTVCSAVQLKCTFPLESSGKCCWVIKPYKVVLKIMSIKHNGSTQLNNAASPLIGYVKEIFAILKP